MRAPSSRTIGCPISENAERIPEVCAVLSEKGPTSYKDLDIFVTQYMGRLSNLGLRRGGRLALYLDSSIDYIALLFALFRLQVVAIALNTRFPVNTIPALLDRVDCSYLVIHEGMDQHTQRTHITLESLKLMPADLSQTHLPGITENQPATVIFSSGSTGTPKAVLHTFGNHFYSGLGSNLNIEVQQGDRWLLSLPLYHVAGIAILFRAFITGATVVLPQKGCPVDDLISRYRITHASLVAAQLQQLLDNSNFIDHGFPYLKALLIGGSAISSTLRNLSREANLPVHFSYGLSEMASQVTTTSPGADENELQSSGSLLSYREIMVDSVGEIHVKGHTLFSGYIEGPDITLPVDEEGWYHTGDLGEIDERGLLWVRGRKDNMFISGGENIYPEQIEKVIAEHPLVRNVMVVPVKDEKFGMRPAAFIDGALVGDVKAKLDVFLGGKLPRYMFPVAYFDWDKAPQKVGIKDSRTEFAVQAEWLLKKGR